MQQHTWEKSENMRVKKPLYALQILKNYSAKQSIELQASIEGLMSIQTDCCIRRLNYVCDVFIHNWDKIINCHAQALASVIR